VSFVATSVRIEATLRRILVVYLDLPPDREEVFSEMFFDRITLGALVDDAKVLLRDERLARRELSRRPWLGARAWTRRARPAPVEATCEAYAAGRASCRPTRHHRRSRRGVSRARLLHSSATRQRAHTCWAGRTSPF